MVASSGGSGGSEGIERRRRRRSGGDQPMSEINVTPFVDVMLVLLIIFMVAAPLLNVGVPIDLPKTDAEALPTTVKEPIAITVDSEGQVFLGEDQIELSNLPARLQALGADPAQDTIYIRGDAVAQYGGVYQVVGVLGGAGYSKFGLVGKARNTQ